MGRLRLQHASTFVQRLGGLLVHPRLGSGEALVLAPCASVHTCFMRYAIDVAFIDREGLVLKVVSALAPWRAAVCLGAHGAIEFAAGQARAHGVAPGTRIDWRKT